MSEKEFKLLGAYIDKQSDFVISLQKGMTSRPAIAPDAGGTGEEEKALFLKEQIVSMGLPAPVDMNAEDKRVPCGYRSNFYTMLPGRDRSRTLWITAHMDVVPPGDLSVWENDPFQLRVEGDFLYGRGVEDNQQAIATGLLALKAFADTGLTPPCNLALLCLSDEENQNIYGAQYIVQNYLHLFGRNDLILIPDMGSSDAKLLDVAEKGVIWFKFTVNGKQCHASTPNLGNNSLLAASELILRLNDKLNKHFNIRNELFDPPVSTFTPTAAESNVPNVNTIPGQDVFYMDCRILPEQDSREVLDAVNKIAARLEHDREVKVKVEILELREPAPITSPDAPFLQNLINAVEQVYGVRPEPCGVGGNTVAVYFRKKNIPCAVWGRLVSNAHMPNECSRISWTLGDAKVVCALALKMCEN